ncbi:MAG: thiamine-phosphate kinase [Dehalococcoidales bacterium]|nr:thiamine-phosphate kinase [Dehalococcoidales bacterium]
MPAMKVSELGEFGLIDLLAKTVDEAKDNENPAWRQLIIGIGDDAAAWQRDSSVELATTDSFIQDIHFTLGIVAWEELGWKAMAANLSDIAAMGGVPEYALISLAMPGHTEAEDIAGLYRGMLELMRPFGVAIAGGNISSAPMLMINITVIGRATGPNSRLLTRSAARPGDKIAVTGFLGGAAAGMEMFKRNLPFDPIVTSSLRKATFHPCPRVTEGQMLVKHGVTAAIDISDGLIADLGHICEASRVGSRIAIDSIPILPEVRTSFGDRALELALSGGEDYELLFTARMDIINEVKKAISCPLTVIGEITTGKSGQISLVDGQGRPFSLDKMGWDHFTGMAS